MGSTGSGAQVEGHTETRCQKVRQGKQSHSCAGIDNAQGGEAMTPTRPDYDAILAFMAENEIEWPSTYTEATA